MGEQDVTGGAGNLQPYQRRVFGLPEGAQVGRQRRDRRLELLGEQSLKLRQLIND